MLAISLLGKPAHDSTESILSTGAPHAATNSGRSIVRKEHQKPKLPVATSHFGVCMPMIVGEIARSIEDDEQFLLSINTITYPMDGDCIH